MAITQDTAYSFGQLGSAFNDGTAAMTPPTGKVFVAITFITDTTFDTSGGLIASQDTSAGLEYVTTLLNDGSGDPAHNAALSPDLGETGAGGLIIDVNNTFPKGLTIYGRWSEIELASGSIIAYIGE